MCGRFTQKSERPDIQLEFYIQGWNASPAVSYNIAPSQKAGVIYSENNQKTYDEFQWGLVPHWAKDLNPKYSMINTKAETVNQKPSFKMPFKKKRCLVPANGFYEWKKEGSRKKPYYIFLKDNPLFSFAGIYDEWTDKSVPEPGDGSVLKTFSIITTDANDLVAEIHDKRRMPVIIKPEHRELWLNNDEYPEQELLNLLGPYENELMDAYEVSLYVNSPNNNSEKCIMPV